MHRENKLQPAGSKRKYPFGTALATWLADAAQNLFAVEVDDGDELDAVLERVVGEADGLGTVANVRHGRFVDVAFGVELLGDGLEATAEA